MNLLELIQKEIDSLLDNLESVRFETDRYARIEDEILEHIKRLNFLHDNKPTFLYILTTTWESICAEWPKDLTATLKGKYGSRKEHWIPFNHWDSESQSVEILINNIFCNNTIIPRYIDKGIGEPISREIEEYRDYSVFLIDVFSSPCLEGNLCTHITPRNNSQEYESTFKFTFCKQTVSKNINESRFNDYIYEELKKKFFYYDYLTKRLFSDGYNTSYTEISMTFGVSQV
ncbi:MAG: hypothetical protein R2795_25590, partial [Saprospiraceae bacterium]